MVVPVRIMPHTNQGRSTRCADASAVSCGSRRPPGVAQPAPHPLIDEITADRGQRGLTVERVDECVQVLEPAGNPEIAQPRVTKRGVEQLICDDRIRHCPTASLVLTAQEASACAVSARGVVGPSMTPSSTSRRAIVSATGGSHEVGAESGGVAVIARLQRVLPRSVRMKSPLAASRPGSLDIRPAAHERATPIRDFVFMSQGASNAYLVTTSDGDVLINTGLGVEAPVHKRCFEQASGGPIRFIVLTQGHVDHVGGIDLFRAAHPGARVVAQRNIHACQADDERIKVFRYRRNLRFYPEFLAPLPAGGAPAADGGLGRAQSVARPDVTFEDEYRFELGGVRFEMFAAPGGETVDSSLVWLPRSTASCSAATRSARCSRTCRTSTRSAATGCASRSRTSPWSRR